MILFLNGIAVSVSAGVCVAYAPVFVEALRAPHPSRGHHLGAGHLPGVAVDHWASGRDQRSSRATSAGLDIYNDGLVYPGPGESAFSSGLLHLWAPEAIAGRVPRQHWVISWRCWSPAASSWAFLAWFAHTHVPARTFPSLLR